MAEVLENLWTLQCIEEETARLERRAKILEQRDDSEEDLASVERRLKTLRRKRKTAAERLPPEDLATFDKLASIYEGEAMAPIDRSGERPPYDYYCGGCFMGVPAEDVNVLTLNDAVRTCHNCGRVLYVPDEQGKKPLHVEG